MVEKTKEKDKIFSKLFSKDNIPIILFLVILINYIPLILPNMISKDSNGVGTLPMAICFGIECVLLVLTFYKNIEITKNMKKNIIALSIISLLLFCVQIKNFVIGKYQLLDLFNIACLFINVLLLFICMIDFKVDENKINVFMKLIVFMGIISCINNMILYFNEILQTLGITKISGAINMKSFFANRNQFAFFLYVTIIANIYVILIQKNNLIYKFLMILFLVNLFFSMSRTGMLVVGIFFVLYFIFCDKVKTKTKIITLILCAILGVIVLAIMLKINPELLKYVGRFDRIKDLSGRTDIWERGITLLLQSPINLIFGVGRFQATELLVFKTKSFSQFHNIYIDTLVTGGIMLLTYILWIYYFVMKKIKESNMDKKYKTLYKAMFITFAIYICFESFGRFSIGCSDTLCLIFFISIPLLHANSLHSNNIKKDEKIGENND